MKDIPNGWTVGVRGTERFPQQSVFKLWVAVAVLDAVDRGALELSEPIMVRRTDLSVFVQPIAEKVGDDGYQTTLDELLTYMVVHSDNAATDLLLRRLGGPGSIQSMLDRKGAEGIRVDRSERDLQSEIAGISWRPEYADSALFDAARNALPTATRLAARDAYLDDPRDTATPVGTVEALAALDAGRLLSPASTRKLLALMHSTVPGALRLKAGLPDGWLVGHRPGTAGGFQGLNLATNNIGLITAPDGHVYAVAVFLKGGRASRESQEALIAQVSRSVVVHWASQNGHAIGR